MIITVSGRHTDLSLDARAYAHSKAERLGTFSSNAHRIDAVLSQPNAHTHQAELTAFLPGSDPLIVSAPHRPARGACPAADLDRKTQENSQYGSTARRAWVSCCTQVSRWAAPGNRYRA